MKKILIVENNLGVSKTISELLEERLKASCEQVHNYVEAMKKTDVLYDLLLVDFKLNGDDKTGADFAAEYLRAWPNARLIMISGHSPTHVNGIEEYVQKGRVDFYDYIVEIAERPKRINKAEVQPKLDELISVISENTGSKKEIILEIQKVSKVDVWIKVHGAIIVAEMGVVIAILYMISGMLDGKI